MNETRIYQKIKNLADNLSQQEIYYTRADLAYELKDLGMGEDSLLLSELVWKCYTHYGKNEKIRKAFVNNEKKRYLVDEFCLYPLAEQGCTKELSKSLENTLDDSKDALNTLERSISNALQESVAATGNEIAKTLIGTKGISDIQNNAALMFERYSNMVNAYDSAKGEVKAIVGDFVSIRNYVNEIYCKYALALTDIFGNSIKSVSPELFDFDSIQYLDVQSMLKNVQLEYNQITEKCGELLSTISESFSNSLKSASGLYRQTGNRNVGLMLAGVEMINHYLDAGQRTNELRGQFLSLKNNVKHDATLIKGDMGRLMLIYKGMNDLHIPRAEAFYRYSQQVLDSDMNQLIESLYNTPELSALKREREELLECHKTLNRTLSDSQLNIDYYTTHIAECETLINSMEAKYVEAKMSKPSKPFFLFNLLSFGSLSKAYNRNIAEWYHCCQPVIKQYEGLKLDLDLDKKDLAVHQKVYKDSIQEMDAVNKKLELSNRNMMQAVKADDDTKKKVVRHLDTLIKLLRIAKEIAETKLDAKQIKTIAITDYRNEQLPAEITQNIQRFSQALGDTLQTTPAFVQSSLDEMGSGIAEEYSDEDLQAVTQAQNQAIQKAVTLFESWANLQTQKEESHITAFKYDAALRKLQAKFQKEMQAIDDKSAILREALKQIKLSQNPDQLREGLLALTDKQWDFTDQDWDDFLNGKTTINL